MYAFPSTVSHLSHHSNLTSHETASTNNNNNTHHNNNNNHRDSSIDKESSLGESSILIHKTKRRRRRRSNRVSHSPKKIHIRNRNRPTKLHSDWIDSHRYDEQRKKTERTNRRKKYTENKNNRKKGRRKTNSRCLLYITYFNERTANKKEKKRYKAMILTNNVDENHIHTDFIFSMFNIPYLSFSLSLTGMSNYSKKETLFSPRNIYLCLNRFNIDSIFN